VIGGRADVVDEEERISFGPMLAPGCSLADCG
jgi:hypothetical protein